MPRYGLIGKNIDYSFSRSYFKAKFERESLPDTYENFDCATISEVESILSYTSISGYNVTIPYKQAVLPFLDAIDEHAAAIGAVNTIKRLKDGSLNGFNTDWIGFSKALEDVLSAFAKANTKLNSPFPEKALILGTGGASKAIVYALERLGTTTQYVSRTPQGQTIGYEDLTKKSIQEHLLVVNCTPLGTYPKEETYPTIPYEGFSPNHIAFDLVYNPTTTAFMKKAAAHGALTSNGYQMLEIQAEAAWNIWQKG